MCNSQGKMFSGFSASKIIEIGLFLTELYKNNEKVAFSSETAYIVVHPVSVHCSHLHCTYSET